MTEQPDMPEARPEGPEEGLDPASQSLADALRVSFWILKAVMLLLVVAFLGWSRHSGFFTVPPQEEALVLRFGAIKGVGAPKLPGKHWSWPYPIESREMVDVRVKSLEIETFFFLRDAKARTKTLDDLGARPGALEPGMDGCLISGDHNLLHALWSIEYRVADIKSFLMNVSDEQSLVKSIFDNAVVSTVAHFKADDLLGDAIAAIQQEVKARAGKQLDDLNSGIEVLAVSVKMPTAPLQVRRAFLQVNEAVSEADQKILEARRESDRILNEAAGPAHVPLANAIGAYETARRKNDKAAARQVLAKIDALLLSNETKGKAGGMIDGARSYRTNLIQKVRAEADYFRRLKVQYDANPRIVLRRLWENTRQRVLENAKAKVFLPPDELLIVDINEDPEWDKAEKKAELEAAGRQR